MTLQRFCMEYSMPLTRTNRLIRALALRALALANGLAKEDKDTQGQPPEEKGKDAGREDRGLSRGEKASNGKKGRGGGFSATELTEADLRSEDLSERDIQMNGVDQVLMGAVRVKKPKGQSRFSYEVIGPERLAEWLRKKFGADLLSDREIQTLLRAGELFLRAAQGEGPWIIKSKDGESRIDPNAEFFEVIENALRRTGHLEEQEIP